MNITHRSWTFATIEKWILTLTIPPKILCCRCIIPTNLTLNIITFSWINNSTVNLNYLFFEFLVYRIKWSIMSHLFLWSDIMSSTISMIMSFFNFIFFANFFWDFINSILLLGTLIESCPVIFDLKLYSSKFDCVVDAFKNQKSR